MTHARPRSRRVPRGVQMARLAFATTRDAGPKLIGAVIALQVLSIGGLLVQLLAARHVVAELTSGRAELRDLVVPVVIVLVAFLVSAASTAVVVVVQRMLAERVSKRAMAVVLEATTRTDLIEFESAALHDRLQRALLNASTRPTQMTLGLVTVLSSLGSFVALGVVVAVISPILFGVAFVVAIPLTLIALGSSRGLFEFSVQETAGDRLRLYLQLQLATREQAKEVRAYGLGRELLQRWHTSYDQRLGRLARLLRTRAIRSLAAVLVATVALGVGLFIMVWLVSTDRLSFAQAATAAAALLVMSRQAQSLANGLATLYETALFMQDYRYFALRDLAKPERRSTSARSLPTARAADLPTAGVLDELRVERIGFRYPSGQRPALDDVSLHIRRGEVVALVGVNGSGKSTLAKLMAGLYAPTEGRITWNATSYEQLDLDQLRRNIAVLFQDFIKFQMSIRANISMGDIERTDETGALVHEAAVVSGAGDVVAGLADGFETELGPQFVGGTELSGGQWQRVALARAAYRSASLVILDEPTAALDPLAEEALFRNTREIFADRAVLLISHRFSSVRLADRIYVLDAGRVVETGVHDELMALDGLYARLYRAQHEALLGPVGAANDDFRVTDVV